jgi:para-nitrobenzyl esterase
MILALCSAAHADPLQFKTAQGKLHGKLINNGKVRAFLGIPYAAPPVGNLRWKAPQPPARWKGVRDATNFGARCLQLPVFADMVFQDGGPSEDCLYLNVFAPAGAKSKARLPVMFWIHGGGYAGGSASEPRHNGDFLPLKGVVLVTINYRLGVFGFLAISDLAGEAGTAGNYGLLDMVAALQWVHANIFKFGGDQENVTIFGESAGSMAVSTLMASPLAQGLFQKAIGESGGALNLGAPDSTTLGVREEQGQKWAASLGANTLAGLRALPAERILAASSADAGAPHFSPVIDGRLLTEPVAATYAAGKQAHVPLLAGWNRDENPSLAKDMTVEMWKQTAARLFPGSCRGIPQSLPR